MGSHAAHPGTHGGALHGRYGAPTATDGSDGNPRERVGLSGKGLTLSGPELVNTAVRSHAHG